MIGLGLSITQRAVLQMLRAEYSPAGLFAAGEQGAWYDPSDMSTMFQDAAGTTPVTAVEQPVGLILDKSQGLVLGAEVVANGTFDSGAAGWSAGANAASVSASAGRLTVVSVSAGFGRAITTISLTAGRTYKVEAEVTSTNCSSFLVGIANNAQGTGDASVLILNAVGKKTAYFVAASTGYLTLRNNDSTPSGSTTWESVSVRELLGNHATQTTATSRPVLSARVNLLAGTETLATQTVTTRATTQTLRFEGAGTVTLSGTATGTYSAGSHSVTTTAGNLTLTVSGTVTKADLRAANMGVGLPAYQRVNTATDYDTAGFPMYLRFDGVDDWLVTPSINFTSTNKMTVFAGVRRLSSTPVFQLIVELSAISDTNNGSFAILGPGSTNSTCIFACRGSTFSWGEITVASPPSTNVLSAAYSTVGVNRNEMIAARNNANLAPLSGGVNGGSSSNNFGNYPLYIGRRGGTTLPFNGHLYSLIVRGAQSTAQQIASAETWVNQRTGAY